jgi:hypothetical protein
MDLDYFMGLDNLMVLDNFIDPGKKKEPPGLLLDITN